VIGATTAQPWPLVFLCKGEAMKQSLAVERKNRICAVVIAGLLLAFGCSEKNSAPLIEEKACAKSANEIVAAIYQFHHERGLWPRDLDELDPDYLKRDRSRGWAYETWYNGRWTLSSLSVDLREEVRFVHVSDDHAEWRIDLGESEMSLDLPHEPPVFQAVTAEDRLKRRRATLRSRIARYPNEILHHKGLISDLYKEGCFQDARDACLTCLERWPDLWWPNVMLSLIDLQLQETGRGQQKLLTWVEKHNDFGHYCILAYYLNRAGDNDNSAAALRKAAELPLKDISVEWEETHEHFGSLGALESASRAVELAYRGERTELCLALCDRYQRYVEENYGPKEYHLYRAACLLRQGKQAEAGKEVDRASKCRYRCCLGECVEKLKQAIKEGNRAFQYVPPCEKNQGTASCWDIAIEYE
jgi:hypothetical protein